MSEGLSRNACSASSRCGWLLLNFPLLTLWDRDAIVLGLPLLPLALFVGWARADRAGRHGSPKRDRTSRRA